MKNALRRRAAAARDADPFPSAWSESHRLRKVIHDAFSLFARGTNPAEALLHLHIEVTRDVRHTEPWLLHLGEIPAGFQQWHPSVGMPDFRFGNLRALVRQTQWRPNAP